MSSQLQNCLYYGKALENQWMNTVFQTHDLCCGCKDTILHLLTILNRNGKAPKPEKDIKNIKCLITGEGKEDSEEDGFGPGELEELFKEEEPDTAAATG